MGEQESAALALTLGDPLAARRSIEQLPELRASRALPLPEAVAALRRRESRRHRHVVITGSPPSGEIGFSIAVLIALYCRARVITQLDTATSWPSTETLGRFLSRSGPFAAAQLASSAGVLPSQRLLASLVARSSQARRRPVDPTLRSLLYLRPHAGAPSTVGGSVTHSHEVIRSLGRLGVAVEAVTTDDSIAATAAREDDPPCRWRTSRIPRLLNAIPASAAFGGDLALACNNLARARLADVIYQRHARFSLAGPLLSALAGRPLFLEYNGSEAFFGAQWQRTPLLRRLAICEDAALAAASRVIVVSDADRRSLIARGVGRNRIVLNPNGVDASRFAVGGGADVRRELGIDDSTIVAGFVGSFGPWHGAPVLAEALGVIADVCPNLRLLFVGDGSQRELTERVLEARGLRGRAVFVGKVRPGDVPRYLDACDILVSPHVPLPDNREFFGSPTKLFEYMAAGKAILASRLGQIAEVLEADRTAILVTPGNADELGDALKHLAGEPRLRAELGANARRAAVERHGWDENASRVVEAYRSLLEESRDRQ